VAVFDNDGTLWCEKPMYIQLDFLIRRFVQQAAKGDLKWFGEVGDQALPGRRLRRRTPCGSDPYGSSCDRC
jgi:hypothetical protein